MAGIALALFVILGTVSGLLLFKLDDQQRLDRMRKTYKLYLPADVTSAQIMAWLKSISSVPKLRQFFGTPAVAAEAWSSKSGIEWFIRVPHDDGYTIAQIGRHIPGARVEAVGYPETKHWTFAREFAVARTNRTLKTDTDTSTTLLASMDVKPDEAVCFQWVFSPAAYRPSAMPEGLSSLEAKEWTEKHDSPMFSATLRIASIAEDTNRARDLVAKVRKAFSSTGNGATQFAARPRTLTQLQKSISKATSPLLPGAQLNSGELANLLGWLVDRRQVPNLPPALARHIPPSQAVPSEGLVIGQSATAGMERPVAIPWVQTDAHIFIGGSSGVGKSTLLEYKAAQIMDGDYGLILMEASGNLFDKALAAVPSHRLEDVAILDLSEIATPVGFNPLDQMDSNLAVDKLAELLVHLYGSGEGVWAADYATHTLKTITEYGGAVTDIRTLLSPASPEEEAWRKQVIDGLKDAELKDWWAKELKRGKDELARRVDSTLGRTWQLTDRPELRNIFGQAKSTISIRDILEGNKILLINLKGAGKAATLLAAMISYTIYNVGQSIPEGRKTKPTFFMVDEFGGMADVPTDFDDMLAQARKDKLHMILATQYLDQLRPEVKRGVSVNAKNWIVFRTGNDDAKALVNLTSGEVTTNDIKGLPDYEALAYIGTETGKREAVSIRTYAPDTKRPSFAIQALHKSRQRYGRPVADVKAEIASRRKPAPKVPKGKRVIGGENSRWAQEHAR